MVEMLDYHLPPKLKLLTGGLTMLFQYSPLGATPTRTWGDNQNQIALNLQTTKAAFYANTKGEANASGMIQTRDLAEPDI